MRDLTRERRTTSANGAASIVDAALPTEPPDPPRVAPPVVSEPETSAPRALAYESLAQRVAEIVEPAVAELVTARRDKWLARIAVHLIETAKLLDPITRIVVTRVLTLAAYASAVGVTCYALVLARDWERVAILVAFLALCALVIRRGQPQAPPEPSR